MKAVRKIACYVVTVILVLSSLCSAFAGETSSGVAILSTAQIAAETQEKINVITPSIHDKNDSYIKNEASYLIRPTGAIILHNDNRIKQKQIGDFECDVGDDPDIGSVKAKADGTYRKTIPMSLTAGNGL